MTIDFWEFYARVWNPASVWTPSFFEGLRSQPDLVNSTGLTSRRNLHDILMKVRHEGIEAALDSQLKDIELFTRHMGEELHGMSRSQMREIIRFVFVQEVLGESTYEALTSLELPEIQKGLLRRYELFPENKEDPLLKIFEFEGLTRNEVEKLGAERGQRLGRTVLPLNEVSDADLFLRALEQAIPASESNRLSLAHNQLWLKEWRSLMKQAFLEGFRKPFQFHWNTPNEFVRVSTWALLKVQDQHPGLHHQLQFLKASVLNLPGAQGLSRENTDRLMLALHSYHAYVMSARLLSNQSPSAHFEDFKTFYLKGAEGRNLTRRRGGLELLQSTGALDFMDRESFSFELWPALKSPVTFDTIGQPFHAPGAGDIQYLRDQISTLQRNDVMSNVSQELEGSLSIPSEEIRRIVGDLLYRPARRKDFWINRVNTRLEERRLEAKPTTPVTPEDLSLIYDTSRAHMLRAVQSPTCSSAMKAVGASPARNFDFDRWLQGRDKL
jgi:hypothetical protein